MKRIRKTHSLGEKDIPDHAIQLLDECLNIIADLMIRYPGIAKTELYKSTEITEKKAGLVIDKVAYVKSQPQTRAHHCHWPGCPKQVPPAMWGCKEHWLRLPKSLRDRIWDTYRTGQEVNLTPSREYLEAANAVQDWIKKNG